MKPFYTLILLSLFQSTAYGQIQTPVRAVGVTIALPWVSAYEFHDYEVNRPSSKAGFFGIGIGVYYKHNKNKFSLNGGMTADLPAPMGPIDFGKEGTRVAIGAQYAELLLHRNIYRRFGGIAGINFTNYRFRLFSYEDNIPSFKKNDPTLGLTVGIEYAISRKFFAALFYRPALVSFETKKYWHLITLDARFDINCWTK